MIPVNAIVLGLAVAFLWGVSPILHKNLLKDMSRHSLMVFGSVIYTICICIYAYNHKQVISEDFGNISQKSIVMLVLSSGICGFLASLWYYQLMRDHPSHIVTALTYSSPIFTLLLAELLLKEHSDTYSRIGILLITAGIVVLSKHNG